MPIKKSLTQREKLQSMMRSVIGGGQSGANVKVQKSRTCLGLSLF